jgi:pimeloyl-ACP methyl ester carboxylesterase
MESVFLLSGLLCDDTVWTEVAARLARRCEIRIVNFPDFNSITAMAKHVLDIAPERFSVAGHSMGGRVALEMYRLQPSRLQRIALLNTGVHPRRDHEYASRGKLVTLAREHGMAALAAEWLPPMMGASPERIAAVLPRLTAMVEAATAESYAAQTVALLERPEAASILPTIDVPLMLLSAVGDKWSPLRQHEEMLKASRAGVLVAVQNAGHMAPIEQPDDVAEALSAWLDR